MPKQVRDKQPESKEAKASNCKGSSSMYKYAPEIMTTRDFCKPIDRSKWFEIYYNRPSKILTDLMGDQTLFKLNDATPD